RPSAPSLSPYTTLFRSVAPSVTDRDIQLGDSAHFRGQVRACSGDPLAETPRPFGGVGCEPDAGQTPGDAMPAAQHRIRLARRTRDRKSTRLNSSHVSIS